MDKNRDFPHFAAGWRRTYYFFAISHEGTFFSTIFDQTELKSSGFWQFELHAYLIAGNLFYRL